MGKKQIVIAAALFCLSVVGASAYLVFTSGGKRTASSIAGPTSDDPSESSPIGFQPSFDVELNDDEFGYRQSPLKRGDKFLAAGNYGLALDKYYAYQKKTPDAGDAIELRKAICHEMQQRYDHAERIYYQVVTRSNRQSHQLIAIAGLARCLSAQRHHDNALEILSDQLLKLGQYDHIDQEIRSQLVYQYAKTLEQLAVGQELDLTDPYGVAFMTADVPVDVFLEAVDAPPNESLIADASQGPLSVKILQQPSKSLNVTVASISGQLDPIPLLLGQIAASANLELFISQRASQLIEQRAKTVNVRATPVSTILDRILASFDVIWYQVDSELYVVVPEELDKSISPDQYWFDAAIRALRRYELNFPAGSRWSDVVLSRANLNLIQRKLDVAGNLYGELYKSQPRDEILAKLFFNMAKQYRLVNQVQESDRFFYHAIDQTRDPNIESSSYCALGASHMTAGDLEQAIRASRRGVASAINDKQRRVAALNLARAYLLQNEPFSANDALFRNRESFEGSSLQPVASLLGTYARYIGVTDDYNLRTARRRLMAALAMLGDAQYESFVDDYAAGQAYEHLGFGEKAINKMFLALGKSDIGQWRRRILFELGILQRRHGQNVAAEATMKLLTEVDDQWTWLALEQLAEIYAELGQTQQCIATCKRLWESDLSETQKRSALQLLGRAYQLEGEHYTAALCFAGILPDKF